MRAVVRDHYCDESRIALRDIALPECAPGEVLIKMTSASLGPDVWHMLTGLPLAGRLAFGLRAPRSNRLGSDFAGVVQQLPSSATGLAVGDRVAGHTHGAFADYLAVRADRLSRIPDGITDAQACALPISGATPVHAMTPLVSTRPAAGHLRRSGSDQIVCQTRRCERGFIGGVCTEMNVVWRPLVC
jgi:NADPH:quinone reductase-like Zn-dependent oxidoreductase